MVKGTPKTPKMTTTTPTRTPKRKEANKQLALEPQEEASEKENSDSVKRARQSVISTYFHRVDKPAPPPTVPPSILNTRFRPFQLKEGMRIAPVLKRRPLTEKEHNNLLVITEGSDFLAHCKTKRHKWTATNTDAQKPKYFHFVDNYRPPYWGTWRRRSSRIRGRRPFGREETLNYEEDSGDDWEDEPEDADECKSDEEDIEKDDDVMDDEENDGFFVDHGYLSSDEGSDSAADEDSDGEKKQRKRNASGRDPEETEEQRRERLAQKAQEWQESVRQKERKARKREELKPTLYMPTMSDALCSSHMPAFCLPAIRFDYSKLVCMDTLMISTATAVAHCSSSTAADAAKNNV